MDYFANGVQLLKTTRVRFPGEKAGPGERLPAGRSGPRHPRVLVNVRVSDFLRQQTSLLVFRDALLAPYGEARDSPKVRRMRVVVLNFAKLLGVAVLVNPDVGGRR